VSRSDDRTLDALRRATPLYEAVAAKTRLLDAIQWPAEVERQFFADGGRELPKVEYAIDRERARKHVIELDQLAMTLDVSDPIQHWLARVARSYADGNRLLLAVGTKRFHELSVDTFGGPRTWFDDDTSNLDLAEHLDARLAGELARVPSRREAAAMLDAEAFGDALVKRAVAIGLPLDAVVDDGLCAKVLAGTNRIRIRAGATFHPSEVEGLFVHEVETHALSAQNGAAQPELSFLRSGGPRTTRTQEGIAVFAELHAHALTVARMRRIVTRVRLVAMAEDGATFLDLYRKLLELGSSERDAYFDAQRICRGGLVEGGAPFTKDACYLAGLMEVFNFLQVAARGGAHEAIELLACGRISFDDLAPLLALKRKGILKPSKFRPRWVAAWDGLLPYFAFTSFLREIDLGQVAARHSAILAATQAIGPRGDA
jgi:uncharacterized protein (TIGR02421 family)